MRVQSWPLKSRPRVARSEKLVATRDPDYHKNRVKRGTQFVIFLVIFAAAANGTAATPPEVSPHSAVERGLKFLQKEAFGWKTKRNCAACHHAPMMIWTFNEARARGYSVDEDSLKEITAWAFGDMKTNSLTDQAPPRNVINLGWVYVLLSLETAPEFKTSFPKLTNVLGSNNEDTLLSARQTLLQKTVSKQVPNGSWGRPLDERVPLGGPIEDIAILSRLALLQSGDHSAAVIDCINNAARWLAANCDSTSRQGRNLRLLMSAYERKPAAELNPVTASIRAQQNADGGWSQTPNMASDAYATGQTLYVLARAGTKQEASEMKRGIEFLTRTQCEDGSWPMTSRVNAKDLGPITAAGTAWAVLGLLRASH